MSIHTFDPSLPFTATPTGDGRFRIEQGEQTPYHMTCNVLAELIADYDADLLRHKQHRTEHGPCPCRVCEWERHYGRKLVP
ncbi:MAG: hypothetical protein MUF54_07945 [Polyangiaceae bacterium]|nr:hypothetical protein [Polyangiaceae bacterium]